MTGGHWRLGLQASDKRLTPYSEVLSVYPPNSKPGRFLRALPRHGENRKVWLMSLEDIPSSDLIFQELHDKNWVTHPLSSLSDQHSAAGYGLQSVTAFESERFFSSGAMFSGA
jgi:hypothetical protein